MAIQLVRLRVFHNITQLLFIIILLLLKQLSLSVYDFMSIINNIDDHWLYSIRREGQAFFHPPETIHKL